MDGEIFYPIDYAPKKTAKAKSICQECQVRLECLEYAFRYEEKYGIYGGMTPLDRKRYLRENRGYFRR